eukprot:2496586-Rhodomonas_salina.1
MLKVHAGIALNASNDTASVVDPACIPAVTISVIDAPIPADDLHCVTVSDTHIVASHAVLPPRAIPL